jgi:hypothetical protein
MNDPSISNMNLPNAPQPACPPPNAAVGDANSFLKIQQLLESNKLKMPDEKGDGHDAPCNSTSKMANVEQKLSPMLKESKSESLGTLQEEMAHLRDILVDCRHENEELLQDTQALLDENECLVRDLQEVFEQKSRLKAKVKALAEKLENAMVQLESKEQEVASLKHMAVKSTFGAGKRTSSFEGDLFSTSLPSGESTNDELGLQVASLKAGSKRQKRSWDLERSRLLEQYNKDQIEKEALREMAEEVFLTMKETTRENRKLQKEATRSARLLGSLYGDELKLQPCRWGFVHRVIQRKERTKKNDEQEENAPVVDVGGEENTGENKSNKTSRSSSEQSIHISCIDDDSDDHDDSVSDHDDSVSDHDDSVSDDAAITDFNNSVSFRVTELSMMLDDQSARSSFMSTRSSVRSSRRGSSARLLSLRQSLVEHNGPLLNGDILEEGSESQEEESEKESDLVGGQAHQKTRNNERSEDRVPTIAKGDAESKEETNDREEEESLVADLCIMERLTKNECDMEISDSDSAPKRMPNKWPNALWPLPNLPIGRNVFKRHPTKSKPAA